MAAAPFALPRIALVLEPVLDEEALEVVADQVRDRIAQAVRDGFADAMGGAFEVVDEGDEDDEGDGTPPVPVEVPFDPNPTVNSNDRFAYQKYAERLDREVPGWWRLDCELAPGLLKQAQIRRARDRAPLPGGR